MHVIAFAARKGGVGKTLLTASMAVLAHRQCQMDHMAAGTAALHPEVAVVDLDPQGCLTNWRNRRAEPEPIIAEMEPTYLEDGLEALAEQGVRYVLVDTPPAHQSILTSVLRAVDLAIIPVRPGELDLVATMKTAYAAERLRASYALVPNGANFRSRAMGEAIRLLRDADLPLLPAVHNRVGLMLTGGQTLAETDPHSRGAQELERLWREIDIILKEVQAHV